MLLTVSVDARLPPMAWSAEVRTTSVSLRCGTMVEHGSDYFVEGAWSGLFCDRDFAHALGFSGSGARLVGGRLLLATSTDTLQPIYLSQQGSALWISNSLVFLLTATADEVREDYHFYDIDLMSVMLGLKDRRRRIPTRLGEIEILVHCNAEIGACGANRSLTCRQMEKPQPPSFGSFTEYDGFLSDHISCIVENAAAPERLAKFKPLATISSGYDSAACSALLTRIGCKGAITFTRSRGDFGGASDSGFEIGRHLGIEVTEHDPELYKRATGGFPEAEFIATGLGGDDIVYYGMPLRGHIVFTGYHGDKVWMAKNPKPSQEIVRGDPSGGSLSEFRLGEGFINFAVPFLGCVRQSDISRISDSQEMLPWSIDGGYNRPIPRRIAEEAGAPRHLFGQRKKAVARPYQTTGSLGPRLEEYLTTASMADFSNFLTPNRRRLLLRTRRKHLIAKHAFGRLVTSWKINTALNRLGLRVPPYYRWLLSKQLDERSLLFHWSVAKISHRYISSSPISKTEIDAANGSHPTASQ